MRRIIVDSGSSIKVDEKEKFGVEIVPIQLQMGEDSYLDGVNLSVDTFYDKLVNLGQFPKTSLPPLEEVQTLVDKYVAQGDEVLIITLSSGISGTFQAMHMLFDDYENVTIVDSKLAVGGIRFLVEEARRNDDQPMEVVVEKLEALISRIVIAAVPETLDYLLAGGRLSKASWMLGKMLSIIPIIGFEDGRVSVLMKKRGLKQSKKQLVEMIQAECDWSYGVNASYTFEKKNIEEVIAMLEAENQQYISVYDNLTPSIACHWGPNAFGFIYVKKA